jgi:hypothetical protein
LLQAGCCQRAHDAVFGNRCVAWLLRAQERALRTTLVAMIIDILGVLLYIFDMYTDIKVGAGGSDCSAALPWAAPAAARTAGTEDSGMVQCARRGHHCVYSPVGCARQWSRIQQSFVFASLRGCAGRLQAG